MNQKANSGPRYSTVNTLTSANHPQLRCASDASSIGTITR